VRTQFHKGSVAQNVPAPTTINPAASPGRLARSAALLVLATVLGRASVYQSAGIFRS
jgi:hypothetical protein